MSGVRSAPSLLHCCPAQDALWSDVVSLDVTKFVSHLLGVDLETDTELRVTVPLKGYAGFNDRERAYVVVHQQKMVSCERGKGSAWPTFRSGFRISRLSNRPP